MAKGKAEKEKSAGKTNVMRLLDAAKIPYEAKTYPVDEADLSGSHAADLMGVDHGSMFKTLVLKGERTGYPPRRTCRPGRPGRPQPQR